MEKNILFTLSVFGVACSALAATTIDPAHNDAYGANIGWVNAEADTANGAVIGQAFCSGYLYAANCGWIDLGDGSPDDGMAYANDSATDFGVNHDGLGNLAGSAYGANIGWITFEQTQGNPNVDLMTGDLSGYAYGANVGWIDLSTLATLSIDSGPDTDADGIPDAWEYGHPNTLAVLADGGTDSDSDGVSDVDEYVADTDPLDGTDSLRITDFQTLETINQVTWTCEPTRLYTLQYSAALSNDTVWVDAGSSVIPSSGPTIMEEVTGVADTERFYRVLAQPPLSP